MANFGKLYDFNVNGGVVLEDTSNIKQNVENAFKQIFGANFSTEASTINGRLIEAITMLFKDVLGVNAQNVNMMNIEQAVGLYLDNLGSMLGISRQDGDSDYSYRKRILDGFSRGSGFASSIANAIFNVTGVSRCVVLDNGMEDPSILPHDNIGRSKDHSVRVAPHSVFISVLGGNQENIALAIMKSKACGCGFTKYAEYGTPIEKIVTHEGQTFKAIFYRPTRRYIKISVTVSSMAYRGIDIVADAKSAIMTLINSNSINTTITKPEIISAQAANGLGIVCTDCTIQVSDSSSSGFASVDKIVLPAYKYANIAADDIEVTVE